VLGAHENHDLPIGRATRIEVLRDGLRAEWTWLQGDLRAERYRNAFDQCVHGAASVRFRPITEEPLRGGGRRYTRWELLEFSLCCVPSNPDAVRTMKALGLWADPVDHDAALAQALADLSEREIGTLVARVMRQELERQVRAAALGPPIVVDGERLDARDLDTRIAEGVRRELQEAWNLITGRVD
jgi:hypothetical protein